MKCGKFFPRAAVQILIVWLLLLSLLLAKLIIFLFFRCRHRRKLSVSKWFSKLWFRPMHSQRYGKIAVKLSFFQSRKWVQSSKANFFYLFVQNFGVTATLEIAPWARMRRTAANRPKQTAMQREDCFAVKTVSASTLSTAAWKAPTVGWCAQMAPICTTVPIGPVKVPSKSSAPEATV